MPVNTEMDTAKHITKHIGRHALIECSGPIAALGQECLETLMRSAATAAGATIIDARFHLFGEGCGVTGVLILAESHITVHTWPENSYAAFDVFMCGDCDPSIAAKLIVADVRTEHAEVKIISRGLPSVKLSGTECL